MAENSKIGWCNHTLNFWMGCSKYSDGCKFCYAETFTSNRMGIDVWGQDKPRRIVKSAVSNVSKWSKNAGKTESVMGPGNPPLVFVGSLMDWAEDHKDTEAIRPLMWEQIREKRNLNFLLLTKRAERIKKLLPEDWGSGYRNVWLGVSIEDMRVAKRVDYLREIPSTIRFISYEPALGPLDDIELSGIDWVIQGGESGSGFRQMNTEWARKMRRKCINNGVSYYYKQGSAYKPEKDITLDGEIIREFPIPRT